MNKYDIRRDDNGMIVGVAYAFNHIEALTTFQKLFTSEQFDILFGDGGVYADYADMMQTPLAKTFVH